VSTTIHHCREFAVINAPIKVGVTVKA